MCLGKGSKSMKKWKFFNSLLKERDWLEEMAEKGWLLTDMTFGMCYHFREIEPAKKVYEIDRFTVSGYPGKQELTARKTAIDIAKQYGWEVVTHDEDMNYYFVKDKAGDESDEFYDDEALRRERAEKFRKRYAFEETSLLLGMLLGLSVAYVLLFLFVGQESGSLISFMWVYIIAAIIIVAISFWLICTGQQIYEELSLSREQWESRKKYGEKKTFRTAGQLVSYLKEKNEQGLMLLDYEKGCYLFEESERSYQYDVDTKYALKKRLKEQGKKYKREKKDWYGQSVQWHEMSIAEAEKAGLELAAVINGEILIYRRECSEEKPDGVESCFHTAENMRLSEKSRDFALICGTVLVIAFVAGFLAGFVKKSLGL